MASFPDLRPGSRSAKAGSVAVRALRSPILLAVSAALLLTAFFAVSELATLRGAKAHDASAYLTRELGSPLSSASLVRKPTRTSPALGGKLELRGGGLKVSSGDDSVTLRFGGTSPWLQFSNGVARPAPFGRETLAFGANRVEQSLLVERHVGTRTWTWKLASNLDARLARDGSVRFGSSPLSILPVAILDGKGRDVTPVGLHWSLREHALMLRLDDVQLPTPYIIDPIVLVGACGPGTGDFAGCSVHNVSNKANFTSSPALRPGSVANGDLMMAAVTIRNNDAITAPAGWTTIGNLRTSGAGLEQRLYYRIVTAADTPTTTYSWSWTNNADASVAIMGYSGVDGTTPFDVTPTDNAGTGTTATASTLTTTQDGDMVVAFYGAQGNVTETQNSGQSLTQEFTALSGSGPASRIRNTGADGTQSTAGATGNKTAAVGSSTPWVAHLVALTPALSADGSGTMGASIGTVSASQTGRTIAFTYTATGGGMINGAIALVVPSGWSAPSTTGANAGYTTASSGTVGVAGQTITVSGVTLSGGSTVTITYGSAAGGGPGATAPSSTGAQTWQVQQKSKSSGTLTNLASSPSITVYAADGAGTIAASINNVSASQTGRTITFTYTAPAGGISGGSVTVAVPSGWSAPSTTGSAAGYSTSSAGTLSVAGSTITVASLTLAAGNTFTITYGSTASGGPGATATSSTGAQTWQAQEKSTGNGSLTNLTSGSPSVTVYAADGAGSLGASISGVSGSQTGRTITFTYTAPTGGISNGSVTLAVPSGWNAPSTTSSAAGYSTSSAGTLGVAGSTITVSSLTLAAGNTFTVTYGDTGGGGPGATAPSSTGAQTWTTQEKSTSTGSLTSIASSPSVTVYAADGSGTLTSGTSSVARSSTGNTLTFTYTSPAGGISNGSVTLAVPSGWSAPSTTGSAPGYATSSAGTLSVASGTITVSSMTLAAGNTLAITYGATGGGGPGATAPSSAGAQTWQAQAKSTAAGSLANLSSSPSITVLSGDGSGTLTTGTGAVNASSTGNTITFTYTAATGGLANGSVTLAVPSGWSAPSTSGSAAGYTTASTGSVSAAGQTVTVSGITLAGGSTFTITYGSTAGGGSGATAPGTAAAQVWQAQEKSSSGGTLTNLASSPAITVNDPTAPSAPSLSYGSFTNASVAGSTVYIRQGSAGGFTVTGSSSDPESGIDHLTFPSGLGTGWTGGGQDSSAPYTGVYTFTPAATPPGGGQDVTATNGWALTSSATSFTVVADSTAPSVTAPSVTAGYYTSLSVPVAKNGGSDGGSGIDATSSILERDDATLSSGSCGSFSGSWTTVTLTAGNDTNVLNGHCYEYREKLSDNVGNQGTSAT
ncbi:MAG TPA: hypothetical protein VKB64_03390, partial [Gaiellaceae bacterium]|nr:hypothetical protein [Gaiellaceae bacterium]